MFTIFNLPALTNSETSELAIRPSVISLQFGHPGLAKKEGYSRNGCRREYILSIDILELDVGGLLPYPVQRTHGQIELIRRLHVGIANLISQVSGDKQDSTPRS